MSPRKRGRTTRCRFKELKHCTFNTKTLESFLFLFLLYHDHRSLPSIFLFLVIRIFIETLLVVEMQRRAPHLSLSLLSFFFIIFLLLGRRFHHVAFVNLQRRVDIGLIAPGVLKVLHSFFQDWFPFFADARSHLTLFKQRVSEHD